MVCTAQQHLQIDEKWRVQDGHLQVLLQAPGLPPASVSLIRNKSTGWLSTHQVKTLLLGSRRYDICRKRMLRGVWRVHTCRSLLLSRMLADA